jgi:PAS domain S-box-containing protein
MSTPTRKSLSILFLLVGLAIIWWQSAIAEKSRSATQTAKQNMQLATLCAGAGMWVWEPSTPLLSMAKDDPVWYSDIFCSQFGYTPAEWGTTVRAFTERVHPEDMPTLQQQIDDFYKRRGAGGYVVDLRVKARGGEWVWCTIQAAGFFTDAGECQKIAGAVLTLSAQAAAKLRYTMLLEASPIAIVTCDEECRIVTFNKAAEELFGYKRAEMVGKTIHALVAPPYRDTHAQVVHGASARLHARREDWEIAKICEPGNAVHADGHEFPVLVTIYGVKTDGKYEYAAFMMPREKTDPVDRPTAARKD